MGKPGPGRVPISTFSLSLATFDRFDRFTRFLRISLISRIWAESGDSGDSGRSGVFLGSWDPRFGGIWRDPGIPGSGRIWGSADLGVSGEVCFPVSQVWGFPDLGESGNLQIWEFPGIPDSQFPECARVVQLQI